MKLILENIRRIRTGNSNIMQLYIDNENVMIYENFLKQEKKDDGYYLMLDNTPPRSTGYRSQNSHFYGHVESIAQFYSISKTMAADGIKSLAVDELEYPEEINKITGKKEALSESKANKSDSNKLIEMCHIYAANEGIKLIEYEEGK